MRITYVYSALNNVGGADKMLINKANYLADVLGYEVSIVTDSQCGIKPFFPLSDKVRHIDLDINFFQQYSHSFVVRAIIYMKLMRIYRKRLTAMLRELKPDIVITTLGREMAFLPDLKIPGCKMIGEIHIAKPFMRNLHLLREKGTLFKWLAASEMHKMERQTGKLERLVVLTNAAAEEWKPYVDTVVIPNFNLVRPEKLIEEKRSKTAIMVGRLNEQKGIDRLISAWAMVNKKHPDWCINIFGSGEDKDLLESQIARIGLKENVIIHTPVKDIARCYMESQFYVMSSRYEGLPMVLLEAMGCGLPCVSFDCPNGPRDIIEDGSNGFLVENGNVEMLADRICWMIEHEDERRWMGMQARESEKRFSVDRIMEMWDKLFHELA